MTDTNFSTGLILGKRRRKTDCGDLTSICSITLGFWFKKELAVIWQKVTLLNLDDRYVSV